MEFIEKYLQSRWNFMRNIGNVIKYSIRGLRNLYIIEVILLVLSFIGGSFITRFTMGFDTIAMLSIIIVGNFIAHIIVFSCQVSKDYGRLLFLTPIKGSEFIIAKILELGIVQLVVIIINTLAVIINGGKVQEILFISISLGLTLLLAYIIIISLIIIYGSYFNSVALVIVSIILSINFGGIILGFLTNRLFRVLPYIYLRFGLFMEINLFEVLIYGGVVLALVMFAKKLLDTRLDIV